MYEPEKCSNCKKPKPIKLVLRNQKTNEDQLLCDICATRWSLSDEEWGDTELPKPYFGPFPQPPNEDKEPRQTT